MDDALVLFLQTCGIVTLIILAILLICAWQYFCGKKENSAKISFKNFRQAYNLTPSRWDCGTTYLRKNTRSCSSIDIRFNLFDYIKYHIWRIYKIIKKRNYESSIIQKNLLESIQCDLERYKKEHNIT